MSELAIETKGLIKKYKDNVAVDGIDLAVPKGSIYGFLGPNGAGKTTTIKMLLGLAKPTSGVGKILGYDIVEESLEIRNIVGYVSETQGLYKYMTVKDIISFTSAAYKKWDSKTVTKYLDLFELPQNRKIKALSKGMRTQLGLVLSLGSQPELLIFDEPTSGLDPLRQKEFLTTIVEQVLETGQTVFFSTHQLWEAERIADIIGIINHGNLVLQRPMDEIKENQKKINITLKEPLPESFKKMPGVLNIQQQGQGYIISINDNASTIINTLNQMSPVTLDIINETMEDVFLEYVRRG